MPVGCKINLPGQVGFLVIKFCMHGHIGREGGGGGGGGVVSAVGVLFQHSS